MFSASCLVRPDESEALRQHRDEITGKEAMLSAWFDAQAARVLADGRSLRFGRDGQNLVYLVRVRGWRFPEGWGRWFDGAQASLRIPASLVRLWGGMRILCHHAFPVDGGERDTRHVHVIADGASVDVWDLTDPARTGVPPRVLTFIARNEAVQVTFRILDPVETFDRAFGCREFGIGILSLEAPGATG